MQPAVPAPTADGHGRELTLRRLEAFSDIVIGFSLGQLGLSLILPAHAIDFVQKPVGLVAFIVTFGLIARFWWRHSQIFRYYFEPNRLMIVVNFIALASLIVQVFALQLYLSFVPRHEGMVAARIYFGMLALAYGALGVMLGLGLLYRWRLLTPALRRKGLVVLAANAGTVIGAILGNAASTKDTTNVVVDVAGHSVLVATLPTTILLGIALGWFVGFLVGRFLPKDRVHASSVAA